MFDVIRREAVAIESAAALIGPKRKKRDDGEQRRVVNIDYAAATQPPLVPRL